MHSLYREGDAKAVVIISQGNSCPIVRRYAETIRSFAEKWEKKGVTVWLLNSNFTDDRASIIAEDREFRFGAPILMDPAQSVSKSLGFTRTGEAVILQPGSWEILYRGAIDDRLGYGVDKQIARDSYLEIGRAHV